MSQPYEKNPQALIRVSAAEIDRTITHLQTAFTDGRLNEKDFDERMDKALIAKTRGELLALTADLEIEPVHYEYNPARLKKSMMAVFSGIEKKGPIVLPKYLKITAVFGGCLLDLRNAQFESDVCVIHITAVFGGVQIFIPTGVRIFIDGKPTFGGFSQNIAQQKFVGGEKEIHIKGTVVFAGVEVRD